MKLTDIQTISDVHESIREGVSVTEITQEFLKRIHSKDKKINAFVRVYSERALEKALTLDGVKSLLTPDLLLEKYPLFGVPFALKDNILVSGLEVSAQSKILEGYVAPYTSDVARLLEQAGAVLLGHANMDEFAMGSSTEFSGYGIQTHNPKDLSRVAGGSSGGPAAAVSAHMAVFSIGSDTGGSVRQPASFTGIFGLRPTWGLLSRYGVVATSSSLDQPGIFAVTASDTELVLNVLTQPTVHDATSRQLQYHSQTAKTKYKIGIPKEYFEGLDENVKKVFDDLKATLAATHELIEVSLPSSKYNIATYYLLMTVEAASNFERFDGIRYGKQHQDKELFYGTRSLNFGPEVTRRIMLGTYASSAGYFDQYYAKANSIRGLITQEFEDVLAQVDLLLTPVSPFPAFKIGEKLTANPTSMYLADIMTLSPALAGNASISVPCGSVQVDGVDLPVGAQLISNPGTESTLFAFLTNNPLL